MYFKTQNGQQVRNCSQPINKDNPMTIMAGHELKSTFVFPESCAPVKSKSLLIPIHNTIEDDAIIRVGLSQRLFFNIGTISGYQY